MKKSIGLRSSSHKRQGIALVTVLILVVMITTLVTISTLLALGNKGSSTDTIYTTQAQNLAEAGIEKALDTVFYETYRRWVISGDGGPGIKFDVCAFKKWLTGNWNASGFSLQKKTATVENNNATCTYIGGTALKPDNTKTDATAGVLPTLFNNDTFISLPAISIDGTGNSVNVRVKRVDVADDISLTIESTSVVSNGSTELAGRKVTRTLQLSGSPFPGDEYAMLTNDINCSFCHLQVDNMTRVYADPTAADFSTKTFKRIKLGALSAVNFDFNAGTDNDTLIAGTLYSRGTAAPTKGISVHFAPWASAAQPGLIKTGANSTLGTGVPTTLYAAAVAPAIYDPAVAGTYQESKAIDASVATAKPKGKLYYNYPLGASAVDGILPEKFPSIIKDGNGDKLLSDAEWSDYMAAAPSGTLTPSAATVVIYGVRRPSSTLVGNDIPISYDPVGGQGPSPFTGSRVGDNFVAGNIQPLGALPKVVGTPMTSAILRADITYLNAQTIIKTTPATLDLAGLGIIETNFATQWRGWLIQQALASPNNRDLRPTNWTADLLANNGAPGLTAPMTAIGFNPVIIPDGQAVNINNFWVAYDPTTNNIRLAYCRADPCRILNGAALATPENGARNASIIAGAAPALSTDIAVLNIPFAASNIFPFASNTASNDVLSGTYSGKSGYFDGNLIVDAGRLGDSGGSQRFAVIAGTVHVNGDLVIRGQIKGEGRFVVRGNVYIVGDLVYGCSNSACLMRDGNNPSYSNPDALPKIAVMAGGSIIVGDYDHPDGRASRSQFNLINDQIGQNRGPVGGGAPAVPTNAQWNNMTVPGATGNNAVGAAVSSRIMGFVHELAAIANNHTNVRFASSPFGFMTARTGTGINALGNYEDTATSGVQVNSLGSYSLQTIYPSNGPMRIGDRTLNGFSVQPAAGPFAPVPTALTVISNPNLSCLTAPIALTLPAVWDGTTRLPLNSGFWCPPVASNKSVRTWNAAAGNPAADAAAWMAQPLQNQGLDGIGMTTGWLGGLLRTNQGSVGFDQLGDISQTRILKIMWMATMETTADRDPNTTGIQTQGPLRTDGMLYSPNAVFCVARYRKDNSTGTGSNTQARWLHHGSLLSFELGFLLTGDASKTNDKFTVNRTTLMDHVAASGTTNSTTNGLLNYAPSMGVYYDERLAGLLGFAGGALEIRRTGVYTQVGR